MWDKYRIHFSRSSYIMTKFQETAAALGRIYEVIDTPSEIDNGKLVLSNSKSLLTQIRLAPDSSIMANTSESYNAYRHYRL